ncbi:MAG: DUF104 domain-containing protein [Planctomycetota bacterium]|nr:MAG: DUF104 domain-containing protein [Planctomycetota bacterium]REJ90458.1 MAG: DUF104 domain-containing protein [Planctomycetota bacterium]REK26241.1 MAG: DUF104 domain-containing protein [Planctomycetota bacterium]REK34373.1 MAG: DUF104 domain-containing protein [Planctomycetota bacterium]
MTSSRKADWYAVTERIAAAIANNNGRAVTISIDQIHAWSGARSERKDLRLPAFWKAEQAGYFANQKFLRAGLRVECFYPEVAPVAQITVGKLPATFRSEQGTTMIQHVRAIYEKGVLRPLEALQLEENAEVQVTVESPSQCQDKPTSEDPFDAIRFDGPLDLAEKFDDYRFGRVAP